MKLDKASKDFDSILDLAKPLKDKDYKPALRLGREALEHWKEGRQKHGWFYFPLLPGETEEGG